MNASCVNDVGRGQALLFFINRFDRLFQFSSHFLRCIVGNRIQQLLASQNEFRFILDRDRCIGENVVSQIGSSPARWSFDRIESGNRFTERTIRARCIEHLKFSEREDVVVLARRKLRCCHSHISAGHVFAVLRIGIKRLQARILEVAAECVASFIN